MGELYFPYGLLSNFKAENENMVVFPDPFSVLFIVFYILKKRT